MALRRRDDNMLRADPGLPPQPDSLTARFPSLWEFISLASWEDGSPRVPGTVLLFVDDDMVKVRLSDRAQGFTAWVSAKSLEGVLEGCERGLRDDGLEWRKDKPTPPKRR